LSLVRVGLVLYAVAHFAFLLPVFPLLAALAYITAISFGEIFVMPFSSNFVYSRLGEGKQGQYVAMYTIAYSVANIVAPLVGTQIIAAWGYHILWTCAGVLALIVFIGVGLLEKKRNMVLTTA
jgi:MFS family permease